MRGRFSPHDEHLYACGMNAWGSSQTASPGGMYRVRATGKPMHLPVAFHARRDGITLTFSDPVDARSASDPSHYLIETWDLRRTANYGSDRFNERLLDVTSVDVSDDGRTVHLTVPEIQPTWTIQIAYKLRGAGGETVQRMIQGTIHQLAETLD
jgi:hypothetical protein